MAVLAIGGTVAVVVVVVAVVVVPLVLLTPQTAQFRATFKKRCEAYGETSHICENKWAAFEQAYVGEDHCGFSEGNYDQLFAETNFKHPCGKTMFWSKTKDLVHEFTKKRDCFVTLEDTLLGSVLDGLEWCGKEGNKETYTQQCQKCQPNPVSSFWKTASTRFTQHACGEASVMLDGERKEPYNSNSFFGGVEVPNLQPSKVTHLTVVLVTKESWVGNDSYWKGAGSYVSVPFRERLILLWGSCTCESLGSLRKDLHQGIGCTCKAVARSHVEQCIEENTPCGACW